MQMNESMLIMKLLLVVTVWLVETNAQLTSVRLNIPFIDNQHSTCKATADFILDQIYYRTSKLLIGDIEINFDQTTADLDFSEWFFRGKKVYSICSSLQPNYCRILNHLTPNEFYPLDIGNFDSLHFLSTDKLQQWYPLAFETAKLFKKAVIISDFPILNGMTKTMNSNTVRLSFSSPFEVELEALEPEIVIVDTMRRQRLAQLLCKIKNRQVLIIARPESAFSPDQVSYLCDTETLKAKLRHTYWVGNHFPLTNFRSKDRIYNEASALGYSINQFDLSMAKMENRSDYYYRYICHDMVVGAIVNIFKQKISSYYNQINWFLFLKPLKQSIAIQWDEKTHNFIDKGATDSSYFYIIYARSHHLRIGKEIFIFGLVVIGVALFLKVTVIFRIIKNSEHPRIAVSLPASKSLCVCGCICLDISVVITLICYGRVEIIDKLEPNVQCVFFYILTSVGQAVISAFLMSRMLVFAYEVKVIERSFKNGKCVNPPPRPKAKKGRRRKRVSRLHRTLAQISHERKEKITFGISFLFGLVNAVIIILWFVVDSPFKSEIMPINKCQNCWNRFPLYWILPPIVLTSATFIIGLRWTVKTLGKQTGHFTMTDINQIRVACLVSSAIFFMSTAIIKSSNDNNETLVIVAVFAFIQSSITTINLFWSPLKRDLRKLPSVFQQDELEW